MLHLVTPLYRFRNIDEIYKSLDGYPDVTWHLAKSVHKQFTLTYNDDRIKLYDVDCQDSDPVAKRDFALSQIKDGYFHLLDDDTLLHPNMYTLYKNTEQLNYKGMIIGKQVEKNGKLRLKELQKPVYCYIDAGNVLCHYSAINYILNSPNTQKHLAPDYVLWEKAYNFFSEAKMTKDVISTYNLLR